jgi:hypothetical protein
MVILSPMPIRFIAMLILFFCSCKRYKDPAPFTDNRIHTPYCNEPAAINYNWDFPGIPDNKVCIFPAQIFKGYYFYRDTVLDNTGLVTATDSFPISITQIDTTHLNIVGFCGAKIHTAKANRFYTFTLDSLIGNGQNLCTTNDTIWGKGQKTGIGDTTLIKFFYTTLQNHDTVSHYGTATKL